MDADLKRRLLDGLRKRGSHPGGDVFSLGRDLCRVLGMDANQTRRVSLTVGAGEIPEVRAESFVTDVKHSGGIVEVLRAFYLVPIDAPFWLVGKYTGPAIRSYLLSPTQPNESIQWEFVGTFIEKTTARAHCTTWRHFMAPVTMDKPVGEGDPWSGCEYPIPMREEDLETE